MVVESVNSVTKTFKFSFPTCTNENVLYKLEVPLEIPHSGSTRELVQRVINMFHIPVYLEDELNEELAAFVAEETKKFHNERDSNLLDQLKNGELDVDGIVKGWEKLFKENVVEFAEQTGTSDAEVFAGAFQRLVHSAALDTILRVEAGYARTARDMAAARDKDIRTLTERQTLEMEERVRAAGAGAASEAEVNALAAEHFSAQALAAGRWGSQLDALRHAQRAQHRAWLMAALDDCAADHLPTPSNSPLNSFPEVPLGGSGGGDDGGGDGGGAEAEAARLEDSFTIHLGSQLKQTHNIRIAAMDLLDLCTVRGDVDAPTETSRRLQTSVSLYGGELAAAVVLTSSGPAARPPPASAEARLRAAAAAATDYHFPHVDDQLREIDERLQEPLERRNSERAGGGAGGDAGGTRRGGRGLRAGDVYVTRHANLPDVHVVFHLVVDDSINAGDMSSRHPVILGLRNVLKAASAHDVTSVALPLLLQHELSEEMTVSWCVRRAELVLKCAKGFVLEGAGGGGAELRTLTFAAPPAAPPALFQLLAALPPHIFRLSTPVRCAPRPPHHA